MGIESATTIAGLDDLWPLSGDFVHEGDNHLRLLKAVLKAQFPGSGGDGFASAITATEAEINYLSGASSNIQTQIDDLTSDVTGNLYAPAATVMTFYNDAAPTGWTQVTGLVDSMMRVVTNSGGLNGGTDSPTNYDWSHTHDTGDHALAAAEIPDLSSNISLARAPDTQSDDHSYTATLSKGSTAGSETSSAPVTTPGLNGDSHNHGATDSAGGVFTPKYVNMILCTKD